MAEKSPAPSKIKPADLRIVRLNPCLISELKEIKKWTEPQKQTFRRRIIWRVHNLWYLAYELHHLNNVKKKSIRRTWFLYGTIDQENLLIRVMSLSIPSFFPAGVANCRWSGIVELGTLRLIQVFLMNHSKAAR